MLNSKTYIKKLPKPIKVIVTALTDFIILACSWYGLTYSGDGLKIFIINVGSSSGEFLEPGSILSFLVAYFLTFFYLIYSGFYRSTISSYESRLTLLRSVFGSIIFGVSYCLCLYFIDGFVEIPYFIYFLVALSHFVLLYAILNVVRDLASYILYTRSSNKKPSSNVLIYGSGAAGLQLLNTIKNDSNINIVGLYDDASNVTGSEISGYRVYGKERHLKELKQTFHDLVVYIAIPSLDNLSRQNIITKLEKLRLAVKTMPGLHELVSDDRKLAEIQDLPLSDLLPRKSINNIDFNFENQNILITGAGGSIGSEIARQLLIGNPLKIILFDISEFNLYKIELELRQIIDLKNYNTKLVTVLGDVKNKRRILGVISRHRVDTIYHSAAYKHVPIVESSENIFEGIKNNIFGTQIVCEAVSETNVNKFVLVSTDKAVRPTNVMGATKRVAEMIAQCFDYKHKLKKFCMVRFGNVINSSGSVIPLFTKQIKNGGPITITHKDVTRFFMTIPEAANLVLQAGELSQGGEVFILNMGEQIKIYELAKRLIHLSGRNIAEKSSDNGIEIREVGLRPGEKLYEELLISGNEDTTENEKILISKEKFIDKEILDTKLKDLREYSKNNDTELAINILKEIVEGYKQKS